MVSSAELGVFPTQDPSAGAPQLSAPRQSGPTHSPLASSQQVSGRGVACDDHLVLTVHGRLLITSRLSARATANPLGIYGAGGLLPRILSRMDAHHSAAPQAW